MISTIASKHERLRLTKLNKLRARDPRHASYVDNTRCFQVFWSSLQQNDLTNVPRYRYVASCALAERKRRLKKDVRNDQAEGRLMSLVDLIVSSELNLMSGVVT